MREVVQFRGRAEVRFGEARRGRIDALQLAHQPADFAEPREQRVVGLAEPPEDLRGKLQQPAAVRRHAVAREQLVLLVGAELRGLDLVRLMAEQIDLALQGRLARRERGVLGGDGVQPGKVLLVFLPQRVGSGEGVEQVELPGVGEQRLVVVRPVQVHEPVAEQLQHGERGRAAIDELAVRAGGGKDALQNELRVLARLHALLFEPRVQARVVAYREDRLDRAALRAGADERFLRPLAEDELERANDDRLARTRLARDRGEARRERPRQLFDEREIADAERGQGGGHGGEYGKRGPLCGSPFSNARSKSSSRRIHRRFMEDASRIHRAARALRT